MKHACRLRRQGQTPPRAHFAPYMIILINSYGTEWAAWKLCTFTFSTRGSACNIEYEKNYYSSTNGIVEYNSIHLSVANRSESHQFRARPFRFILDPAVHRNLRRHSGIEVSRTMLSLPSTSSRFTAISDSSKEKQAAGSSVLP